MRTSFDYIKNDISDISNVSFLLDYNCNHLLNLNLFLTNQCNLCCKYCFENKNEIIHHMSLELADKAIQWGMSVAMPNHKLTISFFGGEPLIYFNQIIKPIILKYNDHLNYRITTNGLLLNKEILDFLQAHKVHILLSIDGIPEINNKQRLGSNQLYPEIFPNLISSYPNITLRMTITKLSIKYFYKSIKWFVDNELYKIDIEPNINEEWNLINKYRFSKQLKKVYLNFGNKIKLNYFDFILNSMSLFENGCYHCGLGTSNCSVNYLGDIYPCQEYLDLGKDFILGNIYTGINLHKHLDFLNHYKDRLDKINCFNIFCPKSIKYKCLSGFCPSKLFKKNKFKTNTQCKFLQSFYFLIKK